MRYTHIHIDFQCQDDIKQTVSDLLIDAAGEAGCDSFENSSDGLDGYAVDGQFDSSMLDEAIRQFPIQGVHISYTVGMAEDKDWNQTWEESGFGPISIDECILVYDKRHTPAEQVSASPLPIKIGIEARQAFGTGTHETTQMVLDAIIHCCPRGKRMLDCGCGTGILSIAALKLGAKEAIGYDIDEWSTKNATHNARQNGAGAMKVLLGDASVLQEVEGCFELVVANINRNILLADLPRFAAKMSSGASLIISGFYESDASLLVAKAKELQLSEQVRKTLNSWCCITFLKD